MSVQNRSLILAFFLTLFLTLFSSVLFPILRLTYFAPFLIIVFYQRSFLASLWFAVLVGCIIDLLSSTPRLGIFALNYALTTFLLYSQRRNFFADSVTTLPMMTFFFCFISTLIQVGQIYIFDRRFAGGLGWAATDLLIMPFFDACYGFIIFVLPHMMFRRKVRRGKDYFI